MNRFRISAPGRGHKKSSLSYQENGRSRGCCLRVAQGFPGVVDVEINAVCIAHSGAQHRVGCFADQLIRDLVAKFVPAVPADWGTLRQTVRLYQRRSPQRDLSGIGGGSSLETRLAIRSNWLPRPPRPTPRPPKAGACSTEKPSAVSVAVYRCRRSSPKLWLITTKVSWSPSSLPVNDWLIALALVP